MAFPLKQLVPCLLFLLSIISFSHGKAQPCECHDSEEDRLRGKSIMDAVGSEFYLIDKESGGVRKLSDSDVNSTRVLSIIGQIIRLWQNRPDGLEEVDEASFSVSATIVYQPLLNQSRSGLAFLILPFTMELETSVVIEQLSARDVGPLDLSNPTSGSASVSGSSISVRIGELSNLTITDNYGRIMVVDITIDPIAADVPNNYALWIDYDRARRSLSVYVGVQAKPKPDSTVAEVRHNISSVPLPAYFGLLTTAEQVRNSRIRWNATIEDLPSYHTDDGRAFLSKKVTILSSVLGSVAATAVMATAIVCYFNSRYRRWQKELDKLARSMERLPGVPLKVDFVDINKATRKFHEDMKLGGGGFGTVYRCTLPAAASKMEQPMDVAIKRFTRDVQNSRYDDFLTEVSIINRLRHKNIVPLIGWSYNKGVPLLVFEFMKNGSLDQHLFHGGGSSTRQRNTDSAIRQWATRYEIIRGVATGLHYVHHEYEPMVLHRDIKASNIMLDSGFQARLGDFGLACTVAIDRNSVTGVGGTWGYIAPEYPVYRKATRQTDIYALGVLILEVVTGLRALADHEVVDDDDMHITDRVWRLHREGRLLECVDAMLTNGSTPDKEEQLYTTDDAERLLLLGLACSNPNPSDRPTMPDVVRVIAKSTPPPQVPPQKPRFVWPPREEGYSIASDDDSAGTSMVSNLDNSMASATRGHASFQLQPSFYVTASSASAP